MKAPRAPLAVAVVLALVAATSPPVAADDEPLLELASLLTSESTGAATRFFAFDTHVANAFDLNGDGRLEIISQNDNHRVYVIDPVDGVVRAELGNNIPPYWMARDENGVAVGDVNANGKPDLVVVNSAGVITAFELADVTSNGTFEFETLWKVVPDPRRIGVKNPKAPNGGPYRGYPSADGPVYLADVEHDGRLWTFMQSDGTPGHYAFDSTGKMRWGRPNSDGNAPPAVADLNGDGRLEAVFATDGGRVFAYDARSGKELWRWRIPTSPGSIPVQPAVIDLNGKGDKIVVFGGRGIEGGSKSEMIKRSHATFAALDAKGRARWVISPGWANPLIYMTPVGLDVNGDGSKDVVFLDWNTIGHKPGNWEVTGKANLFAVDGKSGKLLWRTSVNSWWSNKGVVVADLDGDGAPEILAEHAEQGDGLGVFDARTGKKTAWIPFPQGWGASRGPFAADLQGDGRVQIVVPLMRNAPKEWCEQVKVGMTCREGAFAVYEAPAGARIVHSNNMLFDHDLEGRSVLPHGVRFALPAKPPPDAGNDTDPTTPSVDTPQNGTRFDGPLSDAPLVDDRLLPTAPWAFVGVAAWLAAVALRGRRPR